jgi:hypothetical protein
LISEQERLRQAHSLLGNFDPELLMPDYKIENKNNKTKDGP